jgi:hypothetical protein
MSLFITILLALAPTAVSFHLLLTGAIDAKMLVLLPLASLAYLTVLAYAYVSLSPSTGASVLGFVAKLALLNVGAWVAGLVLLMLNMRMGP